MFIAVLVTNSTMTEGKSFIIFCKSSLSEYYRLLLEKHTKNDDYQFSYMYSLTITNCEYVTPYCNAGIIIITFDNVMNIADVIDTDDVIVKTFVSRNIEDIIEHSPRLRFLGFKTGTVPRIVDQMLIRNCTGVHKWGKIIENGVMNYLKESKFYTPALRAGYVKLESMLAENYAQHTPRLLHEWISLFLQ